MVRAATSAGQSVPRRGRQLGERGATPARGVARHYNRYDLWTHVWRGKEPKIFNLIFSNARGHLEGAAGRRAPEAAAGHRARAPPTRGAARNNVEGGRSRSRSRSRQEPRTAQGLACSLQDSPLLPGLGSGALTSRIWPGDVLLLLPVAGESASGGVGPPATAMTALAPGPMIPTVAPARPVGGAGGAVESPALRPPPVTGSMAAARGGVGRANMAVLKQLLSDERVDGAHKGFAVLREADSDLLLAAADDRGLHVVLSRLECSEVRVADIGAPIALPPLVTAAADM